MERNKEKGQINLIVWRLLIAFMLSCLYSNYVVAKTININNQSDLDGLNNLLNREIQQTKLGTIVVEFKSGEIFKFNDNNRIRLIGFNGNNNRNNLSLEFISSDPTNPANIISDGNILKVGNHKRETTTHYIFDYLNGGFGRYTKNELFLDQDLNPVPISDSGYLWDSIPNMNIAVGRIKLDPTNPTLAYVEINRPGALYSIINNKGADFFKNTRIHWPIWYTDRTTDVVECKNNRLYFKHGYDDSATFDDITRDYYDPKLLFYLTNVGEPQVGKIFISNNNEIYIPKTVTSVYEMRYKQFMYITNAQFKNIEISHLNFLGSSLTDHNTFEFDSTAGQEGIDRSIVALFLVTHSKNLNIHNCNFENIGNHTIFTIYGGPAGAEGYYTPSTSGNISFSYNNIVNCHGIALNCWRVDDININNNYSENTGISHRSGGVFTFWGRNSHVYQNVIKNFSYSGIQSSGAPDFVASKVSGVIERNLLYYDEEYMKNYHRNTLKDQGAIYIWTPNDTTIVRHNVIHDIVGRDANYAIYCDDGAFNVILDGNLIYNIHNDRAIVSPFYKGKEYKAQRDAHLYPNLGNIMRNNIILGSYYYESNGRIQNEATNEYPFAIGERDSIEKKTARKLKNLIGPNSYNPSIYLRSSPKFSHMEYIRKGDPYCYQEDVFSPVMAANGNKVLIYKDIYDVNISDWGLPPFITDRLDTTCTAFDIYIPSMKISKDYIRFNSDNIYGVTSGYPLADYIQTINGREAEYRWGKSYKPNGNIAINIKKPLEDRIVILDAQFVIIGTPQNVSDLTTAGQFNWFWVKTPGQAIWGERNLQQLNPIKSAIDKGLYYINGNKFFSYPIPLSQFSGATIEAFGNTSLSLEISIEYYIKENYSRDVFGYPGELRKYKKVIPISDFFVDNQYPNKKFYLKSQYTDGYEMNKYWSLENNMSIQTSNNQSYYMPNVYLKDGFVGQNGFVAKGTYSKVVPQNINNLYSFSDMCDEERELSLRFTKRRMNYIQDEGNLEIERIKSGICLYPNPTNGLLNLRITDEDSECVVAIYNTAGALVYQKEIQSNGLINLENLPKGIYIAKLTIGEKQKIEKIIRY